jgi:hypothetical protein
MEMTEQEQAKQLNAWLGKQLMAKGRSDFQLAAIEELCILAP